MQRKISFTERKRKVPLIKRRNLQIIVTIQKKRTRRKSESKESKEKGKSEEREQIGIFN